MYPNWIKDTVLQLKAGIHYTTFVPICSLEELMLKVAEIQSRVVKKYRIRYQVVTEIEKCDDPSILL